MEINENKLRIQGSLNLQSSLEIDKTYDFTCQNLEITGSQDRTNNDGTINRTFIGKISEQSEVNIISENEIVKSKPKVKTQSQALRWKIEQRWQDTGVVMDKEDFYIKEMSGIISGY